MWYAPPLWQTAPPGLRLRAPVQPIHIYLAHGVPSSLPPWATVTTVRVHFTQPGTALALSLIGLPVWTKYCRVGV